jgi:hypothetical protein
VIAVGDFAESWAAEREGFEPTYKSKLNNMQATDATEAHEKQPETS